KGRGNLLGDITERIRSAQYAALRAVNRDLIGLYWDIGRMIVERQAREKWGIVYRDVFCIYPDINPVIVSG
ncbi:MAG: hypothetical protein JJD96_06455, partial [Thermoleophilia bacterium]|nr:hypothetical protein [Thermoleophilia bacterium]